MSKLFLYQKKSFIYVSCTGCSVIQNLSQSLHHILTIEKNV